MSHEYIIAFIKMIIFRQFKKFKDKIESIFLRFLSTFSLTMTYLFGVGLTRLVSILVGKNFIPPAAKNSQWQIVEYSGKVNTSLY
jgi:hypothetical protein